MPAPEPEVHTWAAFLHKAKVNKSQLVPRLEVTFTQHEIDNILIAHPANSVEAVFGLHINAIMSTSAVQLEARAIFVLPHCTCSSCAATKHVVHVSVVKSQCLMCTGQPGAYSSFYLPQV